MTSRIASVALAALLVTSALIGGVAVASAASTTTTIDADHPLTESSHIQDFEDDGFTNASLSRVQVSLAVADSAEDIQGYDPAVADDVGSTYLVVEYNEEIDRDLRIHIPDDYFHPVTKEAQCAGSDGTATLSSVNGANHTQVEMSVTGPTRCVIEVSAYRSGTYTVLERVENRVRKVTGVGIPGIGGGSGYQWQHRSASAFGSNSVLRIDGVSASDATVQYKSNSTGEWVPVPDKRDSPAPVYEMTKSDDKDTVWVVADESATQIRFKPAGGATAGGVVSDISSIPERVASDLGVGLPEVDIPFIGDESNSSSSNGGE